MNPRGATLRGGFIFPDLATAIADVPSLAITIIEVPSPVSLNYRDKNQAQSHQLPSACSLSNETRP